MVALTWTSLPNAGKLRAFPLEIPASTTELSMSKLYLIINPHAGRKKSDEILDKITPVFTDAGLELDIRQTRYPGHARILANTINFNEHKGLCAIGGDGTLHEIINGMLTRPDGRKIPLGLIAGGTGNSFMYDLDCLDPQEAARRIINGNCRKLDIARVRANGEIIYGFNLIGWGLPTHISRRAEKLRWLRGQRYNIASLIEIMKNTRRLARIDIDGHTIAGDFGLILACNTVHAGNAMKIAPLARIDDGMIDLLIVRKAGRCKLLSLFAKIFKGGHVGDPIVGYHQVREFSIIPLENHVLNIDGELIGNTPIHVTMLPSEVDVLI